MNSSNTIKRAFYPCCADDILSPLQIMNGMVDEVINKILNGRELDFGGLESYIYYRKEV